jgi:outer membrane protein TolC
LKFRLKFGLWLIPLPSMSPRPLPVCKASISAALLVALSGCASHDATEDALRSSIAASVQRETKPLASNTPSNVEHPDQVGNLGLRADIVKELEAMAGPGSHSGSAAPLDTDLTGQPPATVSVSLDRVIGSVIKNNLDVRTAQFAPAISREQVINANAAFDWVLYGDATWNNIDRPQQVPIVNGVPLGVGNEQRQQVDSTLGVRKQLTTGGTLSVQQALSYIDTETSGVSYAPDPAAALGISIGIDQPLLRGAGNEVATAQIKLAENAQKSAVVELRAQLLSRLTEARRVYWRLARVQQELLILQRLVDRGVQVRDQLKQREALDATPSQIADAAARVERRRADLLRAQTRLRNASDTLKSLMNDPELTLGAESLIIPSDTPVDAALTISALDSVQSALASRPEIAKALLETDDAAIRQVVAKNGTLPKLNLNAKTTFSALKDDVASAYDADNEFIDYIVGATFEVPLGNRGPEASERAARLDRARSVLKYRDTVRKVVLDVKTSLQSLRTNYRLIEQTRASRYAAAEVLRTLLVEKETIRGYSVERLDLELTRQESLAQAEIDEVAAKTDYQISLAELDAATGTAIERLGVEMQTPGTADLLSPDALRVEP